MTDSLPASATKKKSASQEVLVRNRVLRILGRQLWVPVLLSLVTMIVSVLLAIVALQYKVPPHYLPATSDNRILELIPLTKPNQSFAGVTEFGLEALRALHTYDYINWRQQLQLAAPYFSRSAWEDYLAAFEKSNTMAAVTARKMIVRFEPTGEPTLIKEGLAKNGIWVWNVEFPVRVLYTPHAGQPNDGVSLGNEQKGIVRMFISRVPNIDNARGVAIQVYSFEIKE